MALVFLQLLQFWLPVPILVPDNMLGSTLLVCLLGRTGKGGTGRTTHNFQKHQGLRGPTPMSLLWKQGQPADTTSGGAADS